jgi:ankyrin repeat protein
MIQYLLDVCDVDHDQLRERDTSALCTAATSNRLHIVKYLVEHYSAPVDATNHVRKVSPIEPFRLIFLIKCRLFCFIHKQDDDTAIISACDRGHLQMVNYLIEVGNADINQLSKVK